MVKKNGTGCASYIGKQTKSGAQIISLDTNCVSVGTIIHEMIHALGFLHEQSRPDRDRYVTINWDNIQPEYQDQFSKYDYSQVTTFGVRYNTKSIMHYSSYVFSLNGKPTIVTTTGRIIGRNDELQRTDIIKLKRMYNC
ncbi:Zinc metalloproteinase nas-13 [Orchesella cincta]|uniref:Metalloendopeptidase n=1 Tax=Orchesella cincta TaxID=48709 RepID=A0A1D2MR20_ORCCI|nr:Zinc metalloproteinase nas-13 [Orchesella cincta]